MTGNALARTLGPVMIWGLGVGYVISGAYFGWNLGLPVGGPLGLLVATGVVTVLYVCFVLAYAELACALPKAGGAFVYATRGLGPHLGFVGGMAQVVEYVFAPPAIAFAIGSYVNQEAPNVPVIAAALVAYVVFTAINIWGVKLSASVELVLTVLAVLELCVFGAVALPHFSAEKFMHDPLPHGWYGAFTALPFAIWFYLAIEGIANVAEEAKEPQRDLPRGFIAAMATLVVCTAITLFGAVGVDGWQSVVYPNAADTTVTSDSPLPLAISHVVGREHPMFRLLVAIGLMGLVASFHGILIAAGRSILEMGRAGFAPKFLGVVHPTRRTPAYALLASFAIGVIALFTGRTGDIILLSVFGALTLYAISMIALFRLRAREPDLERPYRTPGYPVVPAVALVLSLVCIVAMVVAHPVLTAVYVAILGVSWIAFVVLVPASARATTA